MAFFKNKCLFPFLHTLVKIWWELASWGLLIEKRNFVDEGGGAGDGVERSVDEGYDTEFMSSGVDVLDGWRYAKVLCNSLA